MKFLVGFIPLLVLISIQDCTTFYVGVPQRWMLNPYAYQPLHNRNIPWYSIYRNGVQQSWMPRPNVQQYFPDRNIQWNPIYRNSAQPNLMPYPYTPQRPFDSHIALNSGQPTIQNYHPNVAIDNAEKKNDIWSQEKNPLPSYSNSYSVQGGSGHGSGNNVNSNIGGSIVAPKGDGNGGTNHNDAGVSVVAIE